MTTPNADCRSDDAKRRKSGDDDGVQLSYVDSLADRGAITGDIGRLPDVEDWDRVCALAWRPAWSIRSRRGTMRLLSGLFKRT